jgi:hypothetical protein
LEPLKAAFASEQSQLIEALVCLFLLLHILPSPWDRLHLSRLDWLKW